jgi:hypothetical protein
MNLKPILLPSVFIALFLMLASFNEDSCKLKFNGIYAFKLDNEHSAVLRFYEDGTVLSSVSVNDYMDVFSWFNKENKDMVLSGKYRVKKCNVSFNVKGMTGEIEYSGTVSNNDIQLKMTDQESKKSGSRTYSFFAL